MKKKIRELVMVFSIIIGLMVLLSIREKPEERTYGEVIEMLYDHEEKITRLVIERDPEPIEVTDTEIINKLLYEHSDMELVETTDIPYIRYKINAYIRDYRYKDFYVAVDVRNNIIYTNSYKGDGRGTISRVKGENELVEILESLEE